MGNFDWNVFIEKVGVPMVILAAIGFFIWKMGWPFLISIIENARADRDKERAAREQERLDRIEERNLFLATMKETADAIAGMATSHNEGMVKVSHSINQMTHAIESRNQSTRRKVK